MAEFTIAQKKMDKIEQSVLTGIPASALSLSLTRSAIRMQHSHSWSIDKINSVHDLVICLTGQGRYEIEDQTYLLQPGDAMFIPAGLRFRGTNPDPNQIYTGLAQHFRLQLFGQYDLVARMKLRRVVRLSRWDMLEPVVRHYRAMAPPSSTTLMMHHAFMFIFVEFIEDAFEGWITPADAPMDQAEGLPMAVMMAATQISADPLRPGLAEQIVAGAPYNPDYFRREFRNRFGSTPKKFQEFKRMERAMHLLEIGRSVTETAHEVGYHDAYYFSRMFKRHIGTSPRGYQDHIRRSRDGQFPRGEEDGQVLYPLRQGQSG